jgi:hypothetical protein
MFDHIRMIVRWNDTACPFIESGELGWGALEDGI